MINLAESNATANSATSPVEENPLRNRPRTLRPITLADYRLRANQTWSFRHIRELVPTARLARREFPEPLPRRETGEQIAGVDELMRLEYTDGVLVLHDGSVVYERYARGMRPDDTHTLMSVSKSITGTLAGVLIGRGALAAEDQVVTHIPELTGTSFDGATVRDLLDMRTGTNFDELDATCCAAWAAQFGYSPATPPHPDALAYFATLDNKQEHGGRFEYRSILTDVLGLVLERAGGAPLSELISSELWTPMGAEWDASLTLDRHGFATPNGGINATLRDLGRFGHLLLDGRAIDGRQVVPISFIEDTLRGGPDSATAYDSEDNAKYYPASAGAHYRNQWWVPGGEHILVGLGAHGQHLYVDRTTRVVIAMFSTWPMSHIAERRIPIFAAFRAIADHLSADSPRL